MIHAHLVAALLGLSAGPDADLRTVAERSDYKATARHTEVVDLCKKLAESSPRARYTTFGKSGEGRELPLLIVADPPVSTPEEAARSGKLVAFAMANIHAGEVCGKEALPMLARELIASPGDPILKDVIVLLAPIYNADGNERVSKANRPGQVGPEDGMGQRGNASGMDLNRDFMKVQAPETAALLKLVNDWDPHVLIDTHTTNGSHHRYTMTYAGPKNPAGDPNIIKFTRERMLPEAGIALEKKDGYKAYWYGNFDRSHARWTDFPATPRFGTTYFGLRNRIGILTEAYSYAPYKDRILATRDFVRGLLDYSATHKEEIKSALESAKRKTIAAGLDPRADDLVPIRSAARPFASKVSVAGFVEEIRDGKRVATDTPQDYECDLVQDFAPTLSVPRPFAYLIPPEETAALALLARHGLKTEALPADTDIDQEVYTVDKVERSGNNFDGGPTNDLSATAISTRRLMKAGTVVLRTAQPLGTLAVYLCEPAADDGLATWGLLGTALAAGKEFPIARVVRPFATPKDDAPKATKKPITFELVNSRGGGGRGGVGGAPRWLDDTHWLAPKGGVLEVVDAATGNGSPYFDAKVLEQALADVPGLGAEAASALARGPNLDMDPAKKAALFEHQGDLYYATLDGKAAARLTKNPGREEYATFSPDGKKVAFLRGFDLYVVDVATQAETALTTGGNEVVRNGRADWVYYEEIFNRNWKAYWWSPDSKHLAYFRTDDTPVPKHVVFIENGPSREIEPTPYPRSGEPNPLVKLGIVGVDGGETKFADMSKYEPANFLISHVGWTPDGSAALAQVQDRTQTYLDLIAVPADGSSPKVLFRETTKAFVEALGDLHFLPDGTFLVESERDGYKHLYRYNADGTLKARVTSGEWEISRVLVVDAQSGYVYFTATKDDPIAANLYRVKLDGGEVQRLTTAPGTHTASVSPGGSFYLDTFSDIRTPPKTELHDGSGKLIRAVESRPAASLDEYRYAPRELVKIPARDGTILEGELVLPPDLDPSMAYPVWFTTYGGPHAPTVRDEWAGGKLYDQALASEGFVVFHVDPRSASGKGAASTWAAYRKLGVKELEDITDAINWLKAKSYVDGKRIGMAGHSYGGFLTSYAMTHSDLFASGIAGAPVTDWRDYDSIYTERYMGTPQENPEGYKASSVVDAAKDLHGRLLIAHGSMDDNVSIRNTMRLVHALQQADKDFELMIYPTSRHGIGSRHYSRYQLDFIRRTLGKPKARERAAE